MEAGFGASPLTGGSGTAFLPPRPCAVSRMKPAFSTLALPLLLAAATAPAQTADQATSRIEVEQSGQAASAHIVNRDFVFDSRLQWGGEHPTRLMLKITTDTTQRDDAEGYAAATVSATAWELERAGAGRRQLWSLSEPGNAGEASHSQPLFLVRQSGCCGARDSFSAFDLYTGQRLFTATGDNRSDSGAPEPWAVLEVPNSGGVERLIAFHAAYSATDRAAFGDRQDIVGVLTYAAPDKPLARYRLVATGGAVESFMGGSTVVLQQDGKPEQAPSLTLWPADGKTDPKAIGGFAIRLQLTEDKTVVIPVARDRPDIAAAALPAGLRIEAAPLP
jgi:hypothetical protein